MNRYANHNGKAVDINRGIIVSALPPAACNSNLSGMLKEVNILDNAPTMKAVPGHPLQ